MMKLILLLTLSLTFLLPGCGVKPTTAEQKEAIAKTETEQSSDTTEEKETMSEQNKNPIVTITMENGDVMKAELYPDVAPNSVNNFIYLINSKFYDGTIFHRVIPGFMIQGGDPTGTGMGGPDYRIKGEFASNNFANDLKHTEGVLSMARTQNYNGAGSQFFIMVADVTSLDGDYAAFGKLTEGLDVAKKIAGVSRNTQDKPKQDQKIKTITVDTFGVEYPEPEKITQ